MKNFTKLVEIDQKHEILWETTCYGNKVFCKKVGSRHPPYDIFLN